MVAHIVFKTWGHDDTFYHVLGRTFGKSGDECSRTHTLKIVKNKTKYPYRYVCDGCGQEIPFTQYRHNKCVTGGAIYRHSCGGLMRFQRD
jgi:predicted SprT family Zn-dependent metalloprotease